MTQTARAAKISAEKKNVRKTEPEKTIFKCYVDCVNCLEFVEPAQLESFFKNNIKVKGKAGNTKSLTFRREHNKVIITSADTKMERRYIKYLTKKYLKKNQLRDWLRVVSNKVDGYELRFYKVEQEEEAAE